MGGRQVIALHVRNLHASYGTKAVLRGVDLDLSAGQLLAVLGPSGCGKTTLLRVLAGFMAADSGSIAINGRTLVDDRTKVPSERRKVSIVPQEGALFPHLTVADNVGFGLGRRGDRQERIAAMLDLVGMRGEARSHPNELSGGQQQRSRDRDALLLSTGEFIGVTSCLATHPDEIEHGRNTFLPVAAATEPESDIVCHGEMWEERALLRHDRHFAAFRGHLGAVVYECASVDGDRARIRRHEPGKDPQQRGLSAATRAQDGKQLAGGQIEIDTAQHGFGAVRGMKVPNVEGDHLSTSHDVDLDSRKAGMLATNINARAYGAAAP